MIVGLTGSFGSGCTYIADHVLEGKGYKKLALSRILKERFRDTKGKDPDDPKGTSRRELQYFGDELRKDEGPDTLAKSAMRHIEEYPGQTKWVIDSIRNPAEIAALRGFSRGFFVFGVFADRETRWARVRDKYQGNQAQFEADDKNDDGADSAPHGQRVADCFYEADVVVSNLKHAPTTTGDDFRQLAAKVGKYADLVERPLSQSQPLRVEESLMAMAYAASQRSSCMKRRVGAVIADESGTVISSGFNEVPPYERPCSSEYGLCYRDHLRKDLTDALAGAVPAVAVDRDCVERVLRDKARMLDYCRSLHAEENAILSLVKNGRAVSVEKCTLYTTTYPCRLCANKIVSIGLRNLVYLQPYPDSEAKVILRNGAVDDRFFEGVTFRAYFRIYGEQK